jgi:chromosome segregation ATPase
MFNLSLPDFINPNNIFDISIEVDKDKIQFYYLVLFITNILGTYTYFVIKDKYFNNINTNNNTNNTQINELTNTNYTLNNKNDNLLIQVNDLTNTNNTLNNQNDNLIKKINIQARIITEYETKLKIIEEKLIDKNIKIEKIENRIYNLTTKLHEQYTKYELLKEKNNKEIYKNNSLTSKIEKLMNNLKIYKWHSNTNNEHGNNKYLNTNSVYNNEHINTNYVTNIINSINNNNDNILNDDNNILNDDDNILNDDDNILNDYDNILNDYDNILNDDN